MFKLGLNSKELDSYERRTANELAWRLEEAMMGYDIKDVIGVFGNNAMKIAENAIKKQKNENIRVIEVHDNKKYDIYDEIKLALEKYGYIQMINYDSDVASRFKHMLKSYGKGHEFIQVLIEILKDSYWKRGKFVFLIDTKEIEDDMLKKLKMLRKNDIIIIICSSENGKKHKQDFLEKNFFRN